MGNCSRKVTRTPARDVTLVTLGLDNAGKSTVVAVITKSSQEDVVTTVGYSSCQVRLRKCNVTISDLGGGSRIRGIWSNYFAESHGVVFVIDSATSERIEECKVELHRVLQDSRIQGKPFLIFANKQDCNCAADEIRLCNLLDLEGVLGEAKHHCRVEPCTALYSANNGRKDASINRGIGWLLDCIKEHYYEINERVVSDITRQREEEAQDRRERAERVRKIREERERVEAAAENSSNGAVGNKENRDEEDARNASTISQEVAKEQINTSASIEQDRNDVLTQKEPVVVEDTAEKLAPENIKAQHVSWLDDTKEYFETKTDNFATKSRRDSGLYSNQWKTVLTTTESHELNLNTIPETNSGPNGRIDGRKPFGVRLKPLPYKQPLTDGLNKRWKAPSLFRKNNKTAPIMEENEESLSSEALQPSVMNNLWLADNNGVEPPAPHSPADLSILPINGISVVPGNQQVFLPDDFEAESSNV